MINNIEKYIGIPYNEGNGSFDGVNCYTLVQLYFENELDINLPDKSTTPTWFEYEDDKPVYEKVAEGIGFHQVDKKPFDRDKWKKHDILLFKIDKSQPHHIGIWFPSEKSFLHSYDDSNSVLEDIDRRFSNLLYGVYRHSELIG